MVKVFALIIFMLLPIRPVLAGEDILKNYHPGKWKIDFAADERFRVEYRKDFDFDGSKKDNGDLMFQRLRVSGRAALADKYELFLEGMGLAVGDYHIKKTDQADDFDLHQAYFRTNDAAGLPFDVKLGRQELKYGAGRLIWAAVWSNRINHFDEALLHYKAKDFYADLFSGLRVGYDDHNFNRPNTHEMLNGLYMGYQKDKELPLVETYFLSNLDTASLNNLARLTAGFRIQAAMPKGIVCDLEIPYQFGKSAGSDVSAYAIHFDAGRTFNIPWKPRVNLTYNLASGDKKAGDNKNNTFIPLYQSTHDPYGVMDFFRWQNMQEGALEITFNPCKRLKVIPATNLFWLQSNRDSWYDSTGKKLRTDTSGNAARFVGQEASLLAKYDLNNNVKLETGYAHFFSGPYVKDTGANDDADWVYFQFNVKI